MLPWKTIIQVQKDCDTPVYLQIANAVIREMKKGRIGPGIKLPGTRLMSELLEVHRKTLVRAYEELDAQGWIEMRPSQGTFTSKELPEIIPQRFSARDEKQNVYPQQTGYSVKVNTHIRTPSLPSRHINGFHDGPDVRLIPMEELGRAYKAVLIRNTNFRYMSYVDIAGVQLFRSILSEYLNSSRGVQTTFENIMVTRGCQMALYLLSKVLFVKGDTIIVGDTNYYYADQTFVDTGMQLSRVKVDEHGIDVDAVENMQAEKDQGALYYFTPSLSHYRNTDRFATDQAIIAGRKIWFYNYRRRLRL